jgi:LysR family hca operon transcriptional activator
VVDREPLIVLMPSDHRHTAREAVRPQDFVGEIFIGGSNKAAVLRAVTDDYLRRSGLDIKLDHGVDNMAMAMSLVASTRGLALMPAYAENLLPWSAVSQARHRRSIWRWVTARQTPRRFSNYSFRASTS